VRVLIVDDDQDVLAVLARALARDGYAVSTTDSIAEARTAVAAGVDLLVLDLGLPDGSGLELCRELRCQGLTLPILILTAQTQVAVRVAGLDAGADDYLTKPFALAELRARVRALGRRGPALRSLVHTHNAVTLDLGIRRATRAGFEVPVTAREWAILELLVSRTGHITSRTDILSVVWDDTTESAGNSFEVLIARLRRKFGADFIQTVRGQGYLLSGSNRPGNPG
jgi:two-component system, OmpR family, response regulator